jgi:hypothetical protein
MELVTALVNVCAPDEGRTKKTLLDSPILYERLLLSVPTYPDTHFAPTPGSPRTPKHFPTRIRSVKQWESIVMKNAGVRQILGMESTDEDDSEMTSDSEDEGTESEDLSDHNMPAQEMVNEVPAEMIVEAREAEEQVDDDQVGSFIEEVSQFVRLPCVHLINCRIRTQKTSRLMPFYPCIPTHPFVILPSRQNLPAK